MDLIHWSQYLDGEFSTAKCRQCEAHLASCPECRKKLHDVRHDGHVPAGRVTPRGAGIGKAAIRRRAKAIAKG